MDWDIKIYYGVRKNILAVRIIVAADRRSNLLLCCNCLLYTSTEEGKEEFKRLMFDISSDPIHIFLDFNAVIVNLDSLSAEEPVSYTHLYYG